MEFKSQITVFLENQPGIMADVCKVVSDRGINILAFTVFGSVDHGVLRIIVDKTENAIAALAEKSYLAIESNVIEVPISNSPGTLHKISTLLSKHGINIEYGYGSTSMPNEGERFFLQASDNLRALKTLEESFAQE
jgi:hypothetical protein